MNAIATETQTLSPEARWEKALKEARKQGVKIRQNLPGMCNCCIDLDKVFKTDDLSFPYAYSYGGQGRAYEWQNSGRMGYKDSWNSRVETVCFYHDNDSAPIVAAAFRANGFLVRWDGNDMMSVVVYPNGKDCE